MPVILDSLLTGPQAFVRDRIFYEGDIADRALLRRIVDEHPDLDATIHMAARIVVPGVGGEAVRVLPRQRREVAGAVRPARRSSASRGCCSPPRPRCTPIKDDFEVTEDDPLDPPSPYARTKRMIEQVLEDMAARHRPARDHPALLQPDRLRPRPRVRHLRQGAVARARPAGDGRARAEGRASRSPAPTTRPATAPASATTSTSGTSPGRTCARSSGSTRCSTAVGAPSVVINVGRGDGVTVRELVAAFERVFGHDGPIARGAAAPGRRRRRVRERRPRPRAARLAGRAVPRRGASPRRWPGPTSGTRSWATSDASAGTPSLVAAAGRGDRSGVAGPGRRDPRLPGHDPPDGGGSRRRWAGATIVIDPGHQLGNHNYPRQINRLVPAGGFEKPCNTTGTATNGGYPEATFTWQVVAAAARPAGATRRHGRLTRHSNRQDRWGPCVDVRGRAGNKLPADLKISIHGDGSYAAGAHGFHVIAPDRPAPVDPRHLPAVAPAGPRHPGRPAARRAAGRQLHRRRRRPRLPLRPRHAQPLEHADRDGRARQHAQPERRPADDLAAPGARRTPAGSRSPYAASSADLGPGQPASPARLARPRPVRAHPRLHTAPLVGAPAPAPGRVQEDPRALVVPAGSEPDRIGPGQVVGRLAGEPGEGLARRTGTAGRPRVPRCGAARAGRSSSRAASTTRTSRARGRLAGGGRLGQPVQSLAEPLRSYATSSSLTGPAGASPHSVSQARSCRGCVDEVLRRPRCTCPRASPRSRASRVRIRCGTSPPWTSL